MTKSGLISTKLSNLLWFVSGMLFGMLLLFIVVSVDEGFAASYVPTNSDYIPDGATVYTQVQEWQVEMAELAPRLEKMQYQLQAIHKRVLLPTLDIDMTK
jgi:hypothetical protein